MTTTPGATSANEASPPSKKESTVDAAAMAERDQILLEEALRPGAGAVECEPIGPVELPGRSGPVEVCNVSAQGASRGSQGATQTTVLINAHSVVVARMARDGTTHS